ncbi:hypothetical protein TanjilG_10108 [Lupinus angustifolius]|uniref:Cation/H+ exchanger transmembrane domain-containing protein n=1 Tax=Lupinus angustifolius TaxID=3871 RepID=A0A1J7H2N0_LUPAN|nr:hypothetical protein TanjilG_10108 [Lupinus angustifolius]
MAFDLSSVVSKLQMVSTSDHASVVSMNLFVALLCACIVIGHLLEENRWMNESITALLVGLCTGVIILLFSGGTSSRLLVFSEDLFFIYLLPPIIFNAGFQVKKKQFFVNFMTIMLFGAIGTLISCTIITLGISQVLKRMNIGPLEIGDYLATNISDLILNLKMMIMQVLNQDETPLLYSLVFGEGVVNDATSVVLFNAIQSFDLEQIDLSIALQFLGNFLYLFMTSTLLGVLFEGVLYVLATDQGYINQPDLVWEKLNEVNHFLYGLFASRHSTDREVALMMLMAYLSYMLAELCYLSGILTVFFCGIVMSHYTWHNVTESSRITTKHAFATLSFVAEIFIFLYVGMDAMDIEKWRFVSDSPGTSVAVSSVLLGLLLVGRAAFVFPLSFLSNLFKKSQSEKLSFRQQFTMLGHTQLRTNAIMITSTITVVLVSTVVFGLMTKPLIRLLLPRGPPTNSMISTDPPTPKSVTIPLLGSAQESEADIGGHEIHRPGSLRALLSTPTHTVHRLWRKFDNAFMRPVFGGRGFVPVEPGSPSERNGHQWR